MGRFHCCWTGKCTIGVHIIQLVCNFAVLWNETVLCSLVSGQCLHTIFTVLLKKHNPNSTTVPLLKVHLAVAQEQIQPKKKTDAKGITSFFQSFWDWNVIGTIREKSENQGEEFMGFFVGFGEGGRGVGFLTGLWCISRNYLHSCQQCCSYCQGKISSQLQTDYSIAKSGSSHIPKRAPLL